MRFPRKAAVAGVVAVIAAAVAVPAAVTSSTASAPVNIGMINIEGNVLANNTQDQAAAKAAIRAVNAAGGYNGHPVHLVFCNAGADANQAAACARKMVESKVVATVGGSSVTDAVIVPILSKSGIPMIGWNPLSAEAFNTPNVYLFTGGALLGYQILIAWAAHHGLPIVNASADNPASAGLQPALKTVLTASGAKDFTSTVLVGATQADFAPLVAAAQQGNPKAALLFLGNGQSQQFIQAAESAGLGVQYYLDPPLTLEYAKSLGPAAKKVLIATTFPPITSKNPLMQQYVKEMNAEKAAGDGNAIVGRTSDITMDGWLATHILQTLTAKMPVITAASVSKALNSTKKLDLKGLIPAWTPNAPGPKGLARLSNQAQYIIGYKDPKTQYLVSPRPVTVAEAIGGKF
jgi:ABC-type branched-subunit amino acid transport system substrate-binding protein